MPEDKLSLAEGAGRSGSLFAKSNDDNFLLKTIPYDEVDWAGWLGWCIWVSCKVSGFGCDVDKALPGNLCEIASQLQKTTCLGCAQCGREGGVLPRLVWNCPVLQPDP